VLGVLVEHQKAEALTVVVFKAYQAGAVLSMGLVAEDQVRVTTLTTHKPEVLAEALERDLPLNTGLGVLVHLVRVMMVEMGTTLHLKNVAEVAEEPQQQGLTLLHPMAETVGQVLLPQSQVLPSPTLVEAEGALTLERQGQVGPEAVGPEVPHLLQGQRTLEAVAVVNQSIHQTVELTVAPVL
jgi:hypothetical protein